MTEEEARSAISSITPVSRETWARLQTYVARLLDANQEQNLISRSTEPEVWSRHIWDSAQLIRFAPKAQSWLDIGSGAGLPGLPIAILTGCEVHLSEPRTLRAAFLRRTVEELELARVSIHSCHVRALQLAPVDAITARAVAPAGQLIAEARHLSTPNTLWVLPKGRGAATELKMMRAQGHTGFELHPSWADPEAAILVGRLAQAGRQRMRR